MLSHAGAFYCYKFVTMLGPRDSIVNSRIIKDNWLNLAYNTTWYIQAVLIIRSVRLDPTWLNLAYNATRYIQAVLIIRSVRLDPTRLNLKGNSTLDWQSCGVRGQYIPMGSGLGISSKVEPIGDWGLVEPIGNCVWRAMESYIYPWDKTWALLNLYLHLLGCVKSWTYRGLGSSWTYRGLCMESHGILYLPLGRSYRGLGQSWTYRGTVPKI